MKILLRHFLLALRCITSPMRAAKQSLQYKHFYFLFLVTCPYRSSSFVRAKDVVPGFFKIIMLLKPKIPLPNDKMGRYVNNSNYITLRMTCGG